MGYVLQACVDGCHYVLAVDDGVARYRVGTDTIAGRDGYRRALAYGHPLSPRESAVQHQTVFAAKYGVVVSLEAGVYFVFVVFAEADDVFGHVSVGVESSVVDYRFAVDHLDHAAAPSRKAANAVPARVGYVAFYQHASSGLAVFAAVVDKIPESCHRRVGESFVENVANGVDIFVVVAVDDGAGVDGVAFFYYYFVVFVSQRVSAEVDV